MSDFFSPKELPPKTQEELEARAAIDYSKPWFTSRMPWIHVMSLAADCQRGDQEGKGIFTTKANSKSHSVTLADGTTITAPGYIISQDGRPGPAIVAIDVKKQGELGSTKKVTVRIQAFSNEQFNELAQCYLIPGMSVRVQWGWNTSAMGDKGVDPITEPDLDSVATRKMIKLQETNPNYEGIQGRIVSFSANLEDNNIWAITLEITAAGSMIADTKANDYSDGCVCTQEVPVKGDETKTQTTSKKTSALDAALLQIIKGETTSEDLNKYGEGINEWFVYLYKGYPVDEMGVEDTSKLLGLIDRAGERREPYIRMGLLERIVTYTVQTAAEKNHIFKFDSSKSYLTVADGGTSDKTSQFVFCGDPRVAYIPGNPEFKLTQITNDSQYANASTVDADKKYPALARDTNAGEEVVLHLDSIMINVKYARKVLKSLEEGNDSVLDFLTRLLHDLNNACGNPWEFAFIDSTNKVLEEATDDSVDAEAIIAMVDTKSLTKEPPKPYEFHAKPGKSNVMGVGIDFKTTEAMKTQALYSGTNALATKQNCNNRFGIFQQYSGENLGQPKPKSKDPKDPKPCGKPGSSCDDTKKDEETWKDRLERLQEKVCDETVEAIYGDLVALNTIQNVKDPCAGSIIPVEFSVSLQGIGGIKFGQMVTCDKFPDGYAKLMYHQVVGVEHTIDVNGWTTSVKTVGRYKEIVSPKKA